MNQSLKLLRNIVENRRMGKDACDQLMKKTEDADLRQELMRERDEYEAAVGDAERLIAEMGEVPQPKGTMARAGMWMGMQMNTMMDRSACHIAEITIQGSTMGIVELTKARNANPDAGAEAHGIAASMIARQQEAVDRLKSFLTQVEKEHV